MKTVQKFSMSLKSLIGREFKLSRLLVFYWVMFVCWHSQSYVRLLASSSVSILYLSSTLPFSYVYCNSSLLFCFFLTVFSVVSCVNTGQPLPLASSIHQQQHSY